MSSEGRAGLGRRALELAVLCAFALAQPLFDLLGRNPEFFAVRGSPGADIVLFAAGLVLLPPLVLTGVEALAALAGPRVQDATHAVVRRGARHARRHPGRQADRGPAGGARPRARAGRSASPWRGRWSSAARGWRGRSSRSSRPSRWCSSRSSCSGRPSGQLVPAQRAEVAMADTRPSAPVVMVVFDEFPTTDPARSGRPHRRRPLPELRRARRALHLVLARDHGVRPDDLRRARDPRRPPAPQGPAAHAGPSLAEPLHAPGPLLPRERLRGGDLAVPARAVPEDRPARPGDAAALAGRPTPAWSTPTWSHRRRLEDRLPSISQGWGDFNGGDAGDAVLKLLGGGGRPARFDAWLRAIRPSARPSLNFKHVLLPHGPLQYLPDGTGYNRAGGRPAGLVESRRGGAGPVPGPPPLPAPPVAARLTPTGCSAASSTRLRETGLWDRALVVVAADHGMSFRVGQADRRIGHAGQRRGHRARPAVRQVPRAALGAGLDPSGARRSTSCRRSPTSWASACRGSWTGARRAGPRPAGRPAVDMLTREWQPLRVDAPTSQRRLRAAVERKTALLRLRPRRSGPVHPRGPPRAGRATVARAPGGVGASAELDAAGELSEVDPRTVVPAMLTGRVNGAGPGRHDLALAVNGRVATVTRTFPWKGDESLLGDRPAGGVPRGAQSRRDRPRAARRAAAAARARGLSVRTRPPVRRGGRSRGRS